MSEPLNFTSVLSSNIEAVAYRAATLELYVRFKSGDCYRYDSVTEDVYQGLMAAESKGRYLGENIKGKYPASQVESPDTPEGERLSASQVGHVGDGEESAKPELLDATAPEKSDTDAALEQALDGLDAATAAAGPLTGQETAGEVDASLDPAVPDAAAEGLAVPEEAPAEPEVVAPLPATEPPKTGIAKVGHTSNQLFITFHDGRIWRYDGLPHRFVEGLLLASDRDAYFKANIVPNYKPAIMENAAA